jgi:hypothetical protein
MVLIAPVVRLNRRFCKGIIKKRNGGIYHFEDLGVGAQIRQHILYL